MSIIDTSFAQRLDKFIVKDEKKEFDSISILPKISDWQDIECEQFEIRDEGGTISEKFTSVLRTDDDCWRKCDLLTWISVGRVG